jgi:hypothetical protein
MYNSVVKKKMLHSSRNLTTGVVFSVILLFIILFPGCVPVTTPPEQPPPPSPEPENHPPVIQNMVADPYITPSSSSSIYCIASDADDDELFYSWSCEKGTLRGEGAQIIWNATKEQGEYVISVAVTDGKGGEATDSITITVELDVNQPPIISIIATPKGEPSLTITPAHEPLRVRQGDNIYIECIAEDPDGDEVLLEWSTSGGRIKGEGEEVLYIAGLRGEQEVVVVARDSEGRETVGKVRFKVECCGG